MSSEEKQEETQVGPWKRRCRRAMYENAWMTVYEDDVVRPDGKPGIYGSVHFHNRAIGIVALDDQGRILLVGQHRYPLDSYSWEIPEGGGPADENLLSAAQRELKEETGCTAAGWRLIARSHLSNSVTNEEAFVYLATDLTCGEADPEGTEELCVRWVPFEEALHMTIDGRITDSMSIIGIQRTALMRYAPQLVPMDDPVPAE